MVLTYYINDVQIISSTGTITSSCSLSQCNGYTIDIKVSGDCNSTALAEAIPNYYDESSGTNYEVLPA